MKTKNLKPERGSAKIKMVIYSGNPPSLNIVEYNRKRMVIQKI